MLNVLPALQEETIRTRLRKSKPCSQSCTQPVWHNPSPMVNVGSFSFHCILCGCVMDRVCQNWKGNSYLALSTEQRVKQESW